MVDKLKNILRMTCEFIIVIIMAMIYGAGLGWLSSSILLYHGYSFSRDVMYQFLLSDSLAYDSAIWLGCFGTMCYYILLRKYITMKNYSSLVVISAIISVTVAKIFNVDSPLITTLCIIVGSLYILVKGKKQDKNCISE